MEAISIEPVDGTGPSYYLRDTGTWQQMREYFVHRSLYHLKEGDPHAWAIPRLMGGAKAAFVAVEFDEYGAGQGPRAAPAAVRRSVGRGRSGFDVSGLPRRRPRRIACRGEPDVAVRPAPLVAWRRNRALRVDGDHLAAGLPADGPGSAADGRTASTASRFYSEHVEADAVHEQVVRLDVVGDLVAREPKLDRDIVFGIRAHAVVENRLADQIMASWKQDQTSLRTPLD